MHPIVALLRRAYPSRIPDDDLLSLMAVLGEELSDLSKAAFWGRLRNTARGLATTPIGQRAWASSLASAGHSVRN